MGNKFLFTGQAHEVKAEHLERALRWFATRPQIDQLASDDRTVSLDLDAVLAVAEQVITAQELLKESKKDLNLPPLGVKQRDHLSGDIEQIGSNS